MIRGSSRLRYREDEVYDLVSGEVSDVIYRLASDDGKEQEFDSAILLSRSN